MRCRRCGEPVDVHSCPSCGAEVARDLDDSMRDLSAHDQTAGDQDQTWSDQDQMGSDRDQRSADEDQHAADEDFAAGGDADTYQRSAVARERTSADRGAVAILRDESAAARFASAEARDRAAALRDQGAEGRDALARLHDEQDDAGASREDVLLRAERDRARAAADRAKAAHDRRRAAADREAAARERREAAWRRTEIEDNLKRSTTDELTGAWTRKFGLEEISRELERAHRTGATLVLAFVDIDGLKQVNDDRGHRAGDALLHLVGETLRANVRPYDVIARYGGDEFVCAMPNISVPDARARFDKIAADLAAVDPQHSVTFGLADAEPQDSLEEVIARADDELLGARRRRGGGH